MSDFAELESTLGYTFNDKELLNRALTHSSFARENGDEGKDYERLEFLGDAVLELSVSDHLFKSYSRMDEGVMSRSRAGLVCENALFASAKRLDIGRHIRLSHGEERSGGRDKAAILSDVLEAIIGAIYLDSGFETARQFTMRFTESFIKEHGMDINTVDYKTRLQEYVQRKFKGSVLRYEVVHEEGPDHKKIFEIDVLMDEQVIGKGSGTSKQNAGQAAAKSAMDKLTKRS
ncbi:MAG: ribonuclease III [Eubacteriales bacterium]|nr:ribonuclease III [Eubacteriales bacterium]